MVKTNKFTDLLSRQPQHVQEFWIKNTEFFLIFDLNVLHLKNVNNWSTIKTLDFLNGHFKPRCFLFPIVFEPLEHEFYKISFADATKEINFLLININSLFYTIKTQNIVSPEISPYIALSLHFYVALEEICFNPIIHDIKRYFFSLLMELNIFPKDFLNLCKVKKELILIENSFFDRRFLDMFFLRKSKRFEFEFNQYCMHKFFREIRGTVATNETIMGYLNMHLSPNFLFNNKPLIYQFFCRLKDINYTPP